MHIIEYTYVSLLADVARSSGFSEIRGSYEGLHWCLNEAPKLEKHILGAIETGDEPDLDLFPVWLRRLAAASIRDAVQLRYLRQLLLFCYKAYVTHDTETVNKAFDGFISTNSEVAEFGRSLAKASPALLDSARRECQSVLYRFNEREILPSHGPGAVTTSKEKWQKRYNTIECLYPYSDFYSLYFNREHSQQLEDCDHQDDIQAKLIAVPKDSRGPRLICVHPAEAIWVQQGLRRNLERAITLRRTSFGSWPCGHIFFDDQSVNGRIALLSSRSRRYATIDMKEASDRISDLLIQILFGRKYKWFGCCRAQSFVIPKYRSMTNTRGSLACYAPMGNATTFPVQSLVFWAICVASMKRHGFHQPGAAFVFGDDIIVPVAATDHIINDLESFGLRVNRSKSFWRGAFRESCGVDAFNGVNVTPVRWKTSLNAEHLVGLQSMSDLAQRLRLAGYDEAATTLYQELRTRLRRRGKDLFFTNDPNHGGLAEYTNSGYLAFRDSFWNRDVQWFTTPVHRLEDIYRSGRYHDWNHVLESVTLLERTGRGSVPTRSSLRGTRLIRGWSRVW